MFCRTLSVALAVWSIRRGPIQVVGGQRGNIPCALFQHLRDGRVVQRQAVLNGIAPTIQRAMQTDAAVSMAGDFLLLPMGFIGNSLELFRGECWLGDQFALLVHPGAVRHVNLDPVGPVLQLLTRNLSQLNWPVSQLRAMG